MHEKEPQLGGRVVQYEGTINRGVNLYVFPKRSKYMFIMSHFYINICTLVV